MTTKKDIAIIGGGPGGYVAAIRCAQLKKNVVVFEEDRVGGTCMNYGCIPTKHLLHQTKVYQEIRKSRTLEGPLSGIALNWAKVQADKAKVVERLVRGVEFLFQRYGIELVRGTAGLKDERTVIARFKEEEKEYEAERIILATGSRSAELPFLKADGASVVTSREALELEAAPKASSLSAPARSASRWRPSTAASGRMSPSSRSSPPLCPGATGRWPPGSSSS